MFSLQTSNQQTRASNHVESQLAESDTQVRHVQELPPTPRLGMSATTHDQDGRAETPGLVLAV